MKKYILALLAISAVIGGCKRDTGKKPVSIHLTIKSKVPFTEPVDLNEIQTNGKKQLMSFRPDTSRPLQKTIPADTPKLLVLEKKDGRRIPLSARPGDTLRVILKNANLSEYQATGSPETLHLNHYEKTYTVVRSQIDALMKKLYQSTRDGTYASVKKEADSLHQRALEQLQQRAGELVKKNPGYLANILILNRFLGNQRITPPNQFPALFRQADSMLMQTHPTHPLALQFHRQVENFTKKLQMAKKQKKQVQPGATAPLISASDPNGKEISLERFRGKPLLLVFWSAKDEQSVRVLNRLKKIYTEYHPQGLEIFAVSLDNNQKLWKKAANDSLYPWFNGNIPGWLSAPEAQSYALDTLPAVFMVDKDGKIASRNVSTEGVSKKLDSLITP